MIDLSEVDKFRPNRWNPRYFAQQVKVPSLPPMVMVWFSPRRSRRGYAPNQSSKFEMLRSKIHRGFGVFAYRITKWSENIFQIQQFRFHNAQKV